ncbi:hypothetical protein V8J82_10150 [Gymnodinialimonas sp. 2305UL16-5]|uniref:hypothetical protein n=1 Tax=Gymnodinialimonas mytili TaxID=3126503 RepID=UPI0030A0840A
MPNHIPTLALLAALAVPAGFAPDMAHAHDGAHSHEGASVQVGGGAAQSTQGAILLSCYRGPWDDVIWDRPNPEFIDSLVAVGYSYGEANAIGERVCRDEAGVDNPAAARQILQNILIQQPPRR